MLIEVKVTNISVENILLDIQPFYLVINGSKGFDHCILSDGEKFVNYIILKEKGKISMWNIGGTSNLQYFDPNLPEEVLIKPKESIYQKLVICKELYSRYLEPTEWEVSVWQSWDLFNENTNKVNKIKSNKGLQCLSIPVIKNYVALIPQDKENRKNISDKRKLRHNLSESEFITVSSIQTKEVNK